MLQNAFFSSICTDLSKKAAKKTISVSRISASYADIFAQFSWSIFKTILMQS